MIEDRYEIIKLLGKGRTGGVYEAEDSKLTRKVALRRFFAQDKETDIAEYKEDFQTIAHALSALQHPNLLRVYDAGVDDDGAYVISQLLKGETLADKIKEGVIATSVVYDLAQQILDALCTAHSAGFVHGAITPGSFLMTPRARGGYLYVILDMGLSRLAPMIQGRESILSIMADPALVAPELFNGGIATERSDLYMLGHILYMSLAGGHPFGGVPITEAEKMHQAGLPPLQRYNEDVPADFRLWIEKLVQLNPDNRPATAVEALSSLPKLLRPAKKSPAAAYHTPAGSTTQQLLPIGVSPTVDNPALNPRLATGVLPVSPNPVNTGAGVLRLPAAQKNTKKNFLAGLGAVAAIGVVITIVMASGAKTEDEQVITKVVNKPSKEEVNHLTSKRKKDPAFKKIIRTTSRVADPETSDEENTHKSKKGVITHFNGADPIEDKKWFLVDRGRQEATETGNGWSIVSGNTTIISGIRFPLKPNKKAMFDFGWKLTYVVRPTKGSHRFGFCISKKLNPGWRSQLVHLYLAVEHTNDGKVKISAMDDADPAKSGKSITVPYIGEEGWHTIVIEQKAKAKAGVYSVSIDGKSAFENTFAQGKGPHQSWRNHLLSSGSPNSIEGHWVIKEIKLETL
jgi:serine/threonine protein kinase